MRTAGIIGGLGPQSTSLFYETYTKICLARKLPQYPRLIINSIDAWRVIELLDQKDIEGVYGLLKTEIARIESEVDFLAMVCNSVHAVIEPLRAYFSIPILSIHELVCRAVQCSGLQKVGVLGTHTTIEHGFYQRELAANGLAFEVLPAAMSLKMDRFIFEEMLHGRGASRMKQLIQRGIEYLQQQECTGIILACTELPLFIQSEEVSVPLFSSTEILAKQVVNHCCGIE